MEKLRAGAYEFHYEDVELKTLIEEVWQELSAFYPEQHLVIEGAASLRVDANWFQEAIHNILKNACEQPVHQAPIKVTLAKRPSLVMINIEDAAGGVKDTKAEALFERFNRLAADDSMQNHGLGLAITKMIVERHHGSIVAKNTATGLKISLDLPIHEGYRSY